MQFNMFGQLEEEQPQVLSPMALPTDQPTLPPVPPPQEMNPVVKQYLMPKLKPQESQGSPVPGSEVSLPPPEQNSGFGFDFQSGIAGLGQAIAGKDPSSVIKQIQSKRIVDEEKAGDNDPKSQKSMLLQQAASKLMPGKDFSGASAAQLRSVMPNLEKIAEIEARKLDRQSEMDFRNRTLGLQQQAADREASKIDNKLTEAQKTADKEFAKDYNEWNSRGKPAFDKNIELLESAKARLSSGAAGSGRISGRLPNILRPESSVQAEQDARQAAQGALRATLGSAFTEKEGERIMQSAYDPTLSEEANIEKINRAIEQLKSGAAAMDSRSKVYESEGTLKNYKTTPSTSSGPQPGTIEDGYRFKGGDPKDPNNWEKQ